MRKYRRVAIEDRYLIQAFLDDKLTKTEIARRLNFHKSTISRELKRNSFSRYSVHSAHMAARRRFATCRRPPRVSGVLEALIVEKLKIGWSPEQVSGRLRKERAGAISPEAIYRFIRADKKNGGKLYVLLRRPTKKGASRYYHRHKLSGNLNIRLRPKDVLKRIRVGDWERDSMAGQKGQKVLVCVERKTRYTKLRKLNTSKSIEVGKVTNELVKDFPVHTITNDNGSEFRDHFMFACPVYYSDPGRPNQRGTVENTIGLLRQFIPKLTDLNGINDQEIEEIERRMNHRPRKCLDFLTPFEAIFGKRVALVL